MLFININGISDCLLITILFYFYIQIGKYLLKKLGYSKLKHLKIPYTIAYLT